MTEFDVAVVLFLLCVFVPPLIMLIESMRQDKRIEELELMIWSLLPDGARDILEFDVPTEEEVKQRKW